MAFRNWFKGKDFKKQEIKEEPVVIEEVIEEPKEEVQINVEGTYRFEVMNELRQPHPYGYYVQITYNVVVDFGDYFNSEKINSYFSIHPLCRRFSELEAYEYISSYLGGTLVEKETERINGKLKSDILIELNKLLKDKKVKEAKNFVNKEFSLNISFKAEKTKNGYFQ